MVKPGAKQPGIQIAEGVVVVRVRERAIEGAANAACMRALAEAIGVPVTSIHLVSGARSRHKIVRITGIEAADAMRLLDAP